ncbi:MAG: DUF1440 domain-containing protein [Chitinophagaceae bacterium]|jgi:uncharacterized membrane protein YagU involved in acid resistance|nr:DUF1440 domain-containing protein [Chitinophagaceae bacterium]
MSSKNQKTILAGIIGTAIMTVVMMLAPMMGMPKMSPPQMLSGMLGAPVFVGWLMHFMIGIVFAFVYTYLCILKAKISSVYMKGVVFGIAIFIIAQIVMAIMGAVKPMPAPEGSKMLAIMGSLIGHIIYGIAVAKTVGDSYSAKACSIS